MLQNIPPILDLQTVNLAGIVSLSATLSQPARVGMRPLEYHFKVKLCTYDKLPSNLNCPVFNLKRKIHFLA